jgi:hypothetical protein
MTTTWLSSALITAYDCARSTQFSFGQDGSPSLQDRELMAQDQDLRGLPCLIPPGQPQRRG